MFAVFLFLGPALEHFAGPGIESGATSRGQGRTVATVRLPAEFDDYYQELLRTYVIMGSGNLAVEIDKLAGLLAQAGLTPRAVLDLHLERVERLVRGLGNRSTRHVMARADLLALELLVHLGECYRRRIPDAADDLSGLTPLAADQGSDRAL